MAEKFINYKVELTLHDSSKIRGFISGISNKVLTITNVEFVASGKTSESYQIAGEMINDLSVIGLPKDVLKKKEKKEPKKDNKREAKKDTKREIKKERTLEEQVTPKPQAQSLDDAIIFAKPIASAKEHLNGDSPKVSNKKLNKRQQEEIWGDDVKQIKQSEDFDFATNLALFDKATVFKDLKSKDMVNYSDRLAGHNKVDSPRKVNYDNTEMVLEKKPNDNWENISSKSTTAVSKSSKNDDKSVVSRAMERTFSPVSQSDVSFTLPSGKAVSLCSPAQLSELERIANDIFGVSQQILNENVGIGLAKMVIKKLGGGPRLVDNHNMAPLVLIVASNNRAGARALVAGRHLVNRGVRVIGYVIEDNGAAEPETENSENEVFYDASEASESSISEEVKRFTAFGGKIFSRLDQLKSAIEKLDSPLEIIIDGLQGYDTSISDHWGDDLMQFLEVIKWVNGTRAQVMSIDISSGLDAGSGQSPLTSADLEYLNLNEALSSEDLWIQSNDIVSTGVPMLGLLHAYRSAISDIGDWAHCLIDMGIPRAGFATKGPLKKFDKPYFADEWFTEILVKPFRK